MRKKVKVVTVTLLFATLLAGCNKAGEQAVIPANTSSPVSNSSQAVTPTSVPVATNTPTPLPTSTPAPTETPTPMPTSTSAPTETPTPMPTSTPAPTETPTPIPTSTPVPTATSTPVPTNTPTPLPTSTPSPKPTPTLEPTPTPEPTPVYKESKYTFDIRNKVFGMNFYDGNRMELSDLTKVRKEGILKETLDYYRTDKICYGYIKSEIEIIVLGTSEEWSRIAAGGKQYLVRTEELESAFEETVTNVTVTELDIVMYAKSDVNVLSGPDFACEKLGSLSENQEVKVTGRVNNNWYRIDYNGSEAFVLFNKLTVRQTSTEEEENSDIIANESNAQNNTPTAAPVPTAAPTVEPTPTAVPEYYVTEMNETMYTKRKTTMYKGPGPDYDILGSIPKGEEVLVTGNIYNDWYRIESNGEEAIVPDIDLVTVRPEVFVRNPEEVLATMKAEYEEAGLIYSLDYATPEEIEMFGVTLGMGWSIAYVYPGGVYGGWYIAPQVFVRAGYEIFYLEYIPPEEYGEYIDVEEYEQPGYMTPRFLQDECIWIKIYRGGKN